jgi:hypothetical protein
MSKAVESNELNWVSKALVSDPLGLPAECVGPTDDHDGLMLSPPTVSDPAVSKRLEPTDDRILWGLVANAGRLGDRALPRWAWVSEACGLGSNSSAQLCRRFGFNPDQLVGGQESDSEPSDDNDA